MPKTKQFDKDTVLGAAAGIFRQKGYNGTSIDDILNATGLSRSSLYDSFQDKHNLYLQSLEFYKAAGDKKIESLDQKDLNGLQKLETMLNGVVEHLVENPNDNGCLLVNAAAEMSKQCYKTSQVVCNSKSEVEDILTSWIEDAKEKKLLNLKKPSKVYGQFFYNTLCGLRVLSQTGSTKNEMSNVVRVALDTMN